MQGEPSNPAGDQAPGPESLPEGDTPAVAPAGGTGPGDLPPMSDLLRNALQELEDADRWPHLVHGAGFSDSTGTFTRITEVA